VVFGDEAELLACLGSDFVSDALAARWWWPLLVKGMADPRRAVGAAWLRVPEHAPAALQILAERRGAEAFARALPREDLARLTAAVEARFAMPPAPALGLDDAAPPRARAVDRWAVPRPEPPPPWRHVVEEAEMPGLAPDERAFVGIALALVRAPSIARSAPFAAALRDWREHFATAPAEQREAPEAPPAIAVERPALRGDPAAGALASIDARAAAPAAARAGDGRTIHGRAPPPPASATTSGSTEAPPASPPVAATDARASAAAPADSAAVFPAPEAKAGAPASPSSSDAATTIAEPTATRWSSPSARERHPLSLPPRRRAFGAATDTTLGGLFYLLNVALYLDLYGDEQDLPLPVWDFVALFGRRLLDEANDASHDGDAVWDLLAALAGRGPDEPPGAVFTPPTDWRLPPPWLRHFSPASPRYALAERRLIVEHVAGFPILDIEIGDAGADADAAGLVAAALSAYPNLDAPVAASLTPPPVASTPLDLWLGRVGRYLAARLRRALNIEDDAGLAPRLLVHRARVHVSDTHVDVVLSLDALPIAIRFAGLDRDPGWIAAAGRFLAFHFE
jgi:hypothetical protein